MTRLGSATSLLVGGLLAAVLLALLPAMGLPGSALLVPLSDEGRHRLWPGAYAPPFSLPGSADSTLETRFPERPLVLLITEGCPFCRKLVHQLCSPADSAVARRLICVVASTPGLALSADSLSLPARCVVVVDSTHTILERYRVDAVPALYTLDAGGRVRQAAFGYTDCLRLLQLSLPRALSLRQAEHANLSSKGG